MVSDSDRDEESEQLGDDLFDYVHDFENMDTMEEIKENVYDYFRKFETRVNDSLNSSTMNLWIEEREIIVEDVSFLVKDVSIRMSANGDDNLMDRVNNFESTDTYVNGVFFLV
ncbi:hypothetical protein L1887_17506 [Cichorium endivia]|nr:hypothetical protein L1887_17506 [Cichorium endivia]